MYEEMTFEAVLDGMLDRIDDFYDKRESSPIYAALAPAALEIANIYAALDDMLDEMYADTASREYLIRLAIIRGLVPHEATYAVVRAEFYPDAVEIETGAEFAGDNEDGSELTYRVIEKIKDGVYKLECKEAGEAGNAYTGMIIPSDDIEGLDKAEITEILIYGEDEEDTEVFRKRYMESFKADAFGGNRIDYQNKAMEIAEISTVKVIPVWNGAGTVKLVITGADCRRASNELVAKTQEIFDPGRDGMGNGIAPIGHAVTVDTVEEIAINIETEITYDTGYDWNICKNETEKEILEYISSIRKEWSVQNRLIVRISGVNAAIMSVQGVLDVSGTKINGVGNNLECGECEVPVFGGVDCGG